MPVLAATPTLLETKIAAAPLLVMMRSTHAPLRLAIWVTLVPTVLSVSSIDETISSPYSDKRKSRAVLIGTLTQDVGRELHQVEPELFCDVGRRREKFKLRQIGGDESNKSAELAVARVLHIEAVIRLNHRDAGPQV